MSPSALTMTNQPLSELCFCGGTKSFWGKSQKLVITKCKNCKSLNSRFLHKVEGKSWEEAYVSERFLNSLKLRREIQSTQLIKAIKQFEFDQPILDYGCGQGVLISALLKSGFAAFGADLNPQVAGENIVKLVEPWELPSRPWSSTVLLDVLEHHQNPLEFIEKIGAAQVLLKVPSAKGPSVMVARVLFKLNNPRLLERLFLSDDPHPHYWLFSKRGLRSLGFNSGYKNQRIIHMTEFGREIGARVRVRSNARVGPFFWTLGLINQIVGKYWSDTNVLVLSRTPLKRTTQNQSRL